MKEVILFGAGKKLIDVYSVIKKLNKYCVKEVWDNYVNEEACNLDGVMIPIKKPHFVNDKLILIIPDDYEIEIKKQLIEIGIQDSNIKNWRCCFDETKQRIIERYKEGDSKQKEIVYYLQKHNLRVFNGEWYDKPTCKSNVFFDADENLYNNRYITDKQPDIMEFGKGEDCI